MKPHDLIRSIEDDAASLNELCGEILNAMTLKLERGNTYFVTTKDKEEYARMLDRWRRRHARLQSAVAEYQNVTFRALLPKTEDDPPDTWTKNLIADIPPKTNYWADLLRDYYVCNEEAKAKENP